MSQEHGESEEDQIEQKEEYVAEVNGPQLEIDKSVLTFTAMTGEISMDSVTVSIMCRIFVIYRH